MAGTIFAIASERVEELQRDLACARALRNDERVQRLLGELYALSIAEGKLASAMSAPPSADRSRCLAVERLLVRVVRGRDLGVVSQGLTVARLALAMGMNRAAIRRIFFGGRAVDPGHLVTRDELASFIAPAAGVRP